MTKKATKDKFITNKFAKKYKKEIETTKKFIKNHKNMLERIPIEDILESANQVKSWNRYGVGMQVVSLWSVMIAFILGFVVCAIVVTPIIIKLV